ncbi:hypothetical protein BDZ89DRAFT_1069960 [Hymenopellis radicata]|nr:hypothetical protein BDZ89DRAFT_1069960 [Hymenopellis radicata]
MLTAEQFNQAVRVRSLVIQSSDPARAPKTIKLVANNRSVFEDVESADEPQVAQVLELSEEDVAQGKLIQLRFVRFQKVNSLHVCSSLSCALSPC